MSTKPMPFIDLGAQYAEVQAEVDRRIQAVLSHRQYVQGPEVREVEARLAEYVGVSHCVTASSGTTALQLAWMALDLKPGDEVIMPPFSFFATLSTVLLTGATAVLVDIDPETYNIDPKRVAAAITPKTKAIVPVSLYGLCADMEAINALAAAHGIAVVEDAAQSLGAMLNGQYSGGLSTIGCVSFFPSKPLGCYGDGGACLTNNAELGNRLRLLMNHGQRVRYDHVMLGLNARFDTLQAAILLTKLSVFEAECQKRQQVAAWYRDALHALSLKLPVCPSGYRHVYAQYTIEVPADARTRIQAALQEQGIPTMIHYETLMHHQPAVQGRSVRVHDVAHAERAAAEVLSLPFGPYMSESEVSRVADALKKVLR